MPRQPSRTSLKPPDAAVTAYRAAVRARVEAARVRAVALIEREWPADPTLRADAASDFIRRIANALDVIVGAEMNPKRTAGVVASVSKRVNTKSKETLAKVVPVGVRTEAGVPAAIDVFRRTNTQMISTLGKREVDRMIPMLEQAETSGLRVEALKKKITEEFGVTKSKAELLARDQTLKLAGQINGMRQQNSGITQYTWSTSNDERVRDYHRDLDGTVQDWDTPPIVSKDGRHEHPGGDFQCRCVAIPVIPNYGDLEDEEAPAQEVAESTPEQALDALPLLAGANFHGVEAAEAISPFLQSEISESPMGYQEYLDTHPEVDASRTAREKVEVEKSVPLSNLTAGQPTIRVESVRRFIRNPSQLTLEDGRELPVVVKLLDGQQVILDGHHRLSARKLMGQKKARVVFVDLAKLVK